MNKLDIVREHLITVMQLIAVEASPVSTHVIVMATEEMVRDLAKHRGALLEWDYKNLVKEEHQKIFGKAFRKTYNFYKHANEDPDASFAGPDVDDLRMINEVLTLQNMHGYAKLIGRWSDEMVTFPSWLMLSRPTFFRAELFAMMPVSRGEREHVANLPPQMLFEALRRNLSQKGLLPFPQPAPHPRPPRSP